MQPPATLSSYPLLSSSSSSSNAKFKKKIPNRPDLFFSFSFFPSIIFPNNINRSIGSFISLLSPFLPLSPLLPQKPLSPFKLFFFSSSSPKTHRNSPKYPWENPNPRNPPSSPCLNKWPSPDPQPTLKSHSQNAPATSSTETARPSNGHSAIERIVHSLRNLRLGSDDDTNGEGLDEDPLPMNGNEKLGDLLLRSWVRPDKISAVAILNETLLPWERGDDGFGSEDEDNEKELRKKRVKALTLAELTMEDSELRRLRKQGIAPRERVSVPKAGCSREDTSDMTEIGAWDTQIPRGAGA